MMDIICDVCAKKYRVDETKMKSEKAKVKCKACDNIMVVTKPALEPVDEPSFPPETPEPEVSQAAPISERAIERPAMQRQEPEDIPTSIYGGQKVRFGLFGKIITVMLLVSLLPFAIFWGITLRETNERIRTDTEALMAQTAQGLGNQVSDWIDNNEAILRTAAKLSEITTMDELQQKPVLETIQKQYPYMYLVFTVGTDGLWQTLIGKTSKKPALVLAVPIKSDDQTIGVMAAEMTVDEISKSIATWKTGNTGHAFLVDEKGYVVSHPNRQYVAKRENLNSHPLIANYRKKGWTTITTRFNTSNGQPALGHVRSNNYGWALALQREESEVFSALNDLQKFALYLLGCTILLVSIIAY
jgi:methyl-accepting chemotaxis protein